MENRLYSTNQLLWILVLSFGFFYFIQIPLISSNSDVLLYSLRSKSDLPIVNYAFYDKTFHHEGTPLPNYHIAHTVILWSIYRFMPNTLRHSIWPAGLVSAVAAALSIGISFLIWIELGASQKKALLAAALYGLIPTTWHNALIGEVYSLQYLFVFLFLYFFLKNKIGLSALSFSLANLVSPISGLSFSLVLIGNRIKNKPIKAAVVGLLAVVFYVLIISVFQINPLRAFDAISSSQRNLLWKSYKFSVILLLNINFFIYSIGRGIKTPGAINWKFYSVLILSISPQLILGFYDSQFLVEKGSFLSVIFWAISFMIADNMLAKNKHMNVLILSVLANFIIYGIFWKMPELEITQARRSAAFELNKRGLNHVKISGSWSHAVGLIVERDGWDLQNLSGTLIDIPNPTEQDLERTMEDSLLIVHFNRDGWIARTSKAVFPKSMTNLYDPRNTTFKDILEEKVRNKYFIIYLWKKSKTPPDHTH